MRTLIALSIVLAYVIFTVAILRAHRRKAAASASALASASTATAASASTSDVQHRACAGATPSSARAPWLVAFASQTGYAEQLALQTAKSLEAANIPMRVRSLEKLSMDEISRAERALFIVSTYGEGDPPDAGLAFVSTVMSRTPPLAQLGYGVLALGDRTYRNFCGFGRTLDAWLRQQSATPFFDLIEMDNADENALRHWQHQVGTLTGRDDLPEWQAPRDERWQIAQRRLLNPGSAGLPCYHIELVPLEGALPDWQAGDIAVLTPPGGGPREYSIASTPKDGALHILVRQSRRADGTPGVASSWLTQGAAPGSEVPLRIRVNSNFRSPPDSRPLILIGNGTGIAGLRSHLKVRESQARERNGATRNWLLFGERNARSDSFYAQDIERWKSSGLLSRVDLAFSRDQHERVYVQHLIPPAANMLREWVTQGAAIYVCGSAEGMASAVDEALAAVLSRDTLDQLMAERRYRRDVY